MDNERLKVYLDKTHLEPGKNWRSGFMGALARSKVVITLLSPESLDNLRESHTFPNDRANNCLAELGMVSD